MEIIVWFLGTWFCWVFSDLVQHIRTHGLNTPDPEKHERWAAKQAEK